MFPGGGYVSYGSYFTSREVLIPGATSPGATARPTLGHRGQFYFSWGFRRDYTLIAAVPVVTTRWSPPSGQGSTLGGTGLGDVLLLLKHRFIRLDSPRGTTQLSVSIGPKFPTGRTAVRDPAGNRLPVGLRPGSGSTDLFIGIDTTHTGLFGIRRLVADESVSFWVRSEGSQDMKLGNAFESRFWLHYRPYQTRDVSREWFIGPVVVYQHNWHDRLAGITRRDSGGSTLLLGLATYVGVRPGTHVWFQADFPVVRTSSGAPTHATRRFSFGITQQFLLPR
jgi:hypothetical protein